jgi:hypothetical protein
MLNLYNSFNLTDGFRQHLRLYYPVQFTRHQVDLQAAQREYVIAMHVRRGDACERWAEEGDYDNVGGRPCWELEVYMQAARRMRKVYGVRSILLATDSHAVQHEARTKYPEFNWGFLQFDRKAVGGDEKQHQHPPQELSMKPAKKLGQPNPRFIENMAQAGELKLDVVTTSAIGDMELLSQGDMFIGGSTSMFARTIFVLMYGRLGVLPPFHFVDQPFCPLRHYSHEHLCEDP